MTDLNSPQPIKGTPEVAPIPEPSTGVVITSSTPVNDPVNVTALPIENVLPAQIKTTFLHKSEIDAEDAWKWLLLEIKKL